MRAPMQPAPCALARTHLHSCWPGVQLTGRGLGLLLGLSQALQEALVLLGQGAAVKAPAQAGGQHLDELDRRHAQQLVQVNAAIGKLLGGPALAGRLLLQARKGGEGGRGERTAKGEAQSQPKASKSAPTQPRGAKVRHSRQQGTTQHQQQELTSSAMIELQETVLKKRLE